ncbi:MAG: hypothetical protein AABZ44_07850 [Elusimicrobiota bacterium]
MEARLSQNLNVRQTLQGRLAAAKWIAMNESEVAKEVEGLETDPVFKELYHGVAGGKPLIRRKRWPAAKLASGFYGLNEGLAAASDSSDISDLLERHSRLLGLIRKIGKDDFERYFLYGEGTDPLCDVAKRLGITQEQAKEILDLVVEIDTRSQFSRPMAGTARESLGYNCIARIDKDPSNVDGFYFEFLSPHWARGQYEVDFDQLDVWKRSKNLSSEEKRQLRAILKKIEFLNMRQDTLFNIINRIIVNQTPYLNSRNDVKRRPLSLRELARRIGVSPSTVSRAVGRRSILLPWGEEMPLKSLLTSQRTVILTILKHWIETDKLATMSTDGLLTEKLAQEYGIVVSRRTVNQCRRLAQQGT